MRRHTSTFIWLLTRIRASSSASLMSRASSTGWLPSTGVTSFRACIRRMVKWLGQVLSMPMGPASTSAASSATGSSVSS